MTFNINEEKEWSSQYKKIQNEVESQLFKNLATEPIKGKENYIFGKLKTWKDCIKTNFHSQEVLYDVYCNARAVIEIDFIYRQGKNHYPEVYLQECKYTTIQKVQHTMLSDDDEV